MTQEIILGVDPGTRICGYGLIHIQRNAYELIDYGTIRPSPKQSLAERYYLLFQGIEEIIETFSPSSLALETQYVQKNVQSAMKLGMARAAILIAAVKSSIPVFEYAPTTAKKSVCGRGLASKQQVQEMVRHLLSLESAPKPEDAADALSLAICHAHHQQQRSLS